MAIYAIDFDNTLAITRFPEIIAPNKKMVAFAKAVKAQGHQESIAQYIVFVNVVFLYIGRNRIGKVGFTWSQGLLP